MGEQFTEQRLEIRPAPLTLKTVETARRPVQSALAFDWSGDLKEAET
ncbi:hypothetical protein G7043_25400 [Lentzea sp. NEAU-D13]|uniref:Uncharacterized protein n=1 Tax=Lentzea alba TaxID=2714351 RepID=A0A7C9RUK8_9PSEU|nr:hypothetical protein [Lentzea alba]NGY62263.1 hypothetical protein [Lentzea alba]